MFPLLVVLGYPDGSQVNARIMCFKERLLKGKCVVFWAVKVTLIIGCWEITFLEAMSEPFLLHDLQVIPRFQPFSTHKLMTLTSPLPSLTYLPISRPPSSAPWWASPGGWLTGISQFACLNGTQPSSTSNSFHCSLGNCHKPSSNFILIIGK